MISFKAIIFFLRDWFQFFIWISRARFLSDINKDLEIAALRSQLSILQRQVFDHKIPKPHFTPAFRQLWVLLSKFFPDWKSALFLVKPETVIGWHRKAFKFYWMIKSKKSGRPKISRQTIALIKRIHKENPLLSPEKIYERLVDLAVIDAPSPNTISKYIPKIRKPPSEKQKQSWTTFLKNHCKEIWAMDFFTVPTLYFTVLYVFILISHDRRKIEHFAVTTNPSSAWVAQQIREATPFGNTPKYLIHDNDSIFTSKELCKFLENANVKTKKTGFKCPWQNGICERTVGILRHELLNHIIPVNERHLEHLLKEYIGKYYNTVRTHQGIDCKTPILREKSHQTTIAKTVLKSKPILNGLYHDYQKVA